MSLVGKVALVTGSGTGIGKGIAIELARRGCKVAINYNKSDAGALDTQQQIKALQGDSIIIQADVSNKLDVERMVKQVVDHYGTIDILVNNAALQLNYDFFDYEGATFDRMMSTNLKGYWQCTQAVVPYMKKKNVGRVINISSVHSKRPTDFDVLYSMTKGGIRMMSRESAIELAKYGITVNIIEPGAVDVGKQSARESKPIVSEEDKAKLSQEENKIFKKFPMGRVGKPSDVASLVCYIASDETQFMTGSSIRLDGGSMLL